MLMAILLVTFAVLQPSSLAADQVPVRHKEGLVHGFLALRTLQGKKLADGELIQQTQGDRITSDLIFHFDDGSFYEDKTVFTQDGSFRLLNDHLVQKGPSFKQPMEISIDAPGGRVTVRYKDGRGEEKEVGQVLELPPDVANGLMLTLVKDIKPTTPQTTVSMLAATPKPRLVKLVISPEGEKLISSGNIRHKAMVYDVKVQIGGMFGLLARVMGKIPPDTHVWVLEGEAPAFVKSEGPLYQGGPIWKIELANPSGFP
jgi:hypothetical protein